jgi:hypothetical protein
MRITYLRGGVRRRRSKPTSLAPHHTQFAMGKTAPLNGVLARNESVRGALQLR